MTTTSSVKNESTAPVIPAAMLAGVWNGTSAEIRPEIIPTPRPNADEALIKVAACGVCHTDLHVLKGEVAFPGPGVLGHEVSSTVVALGPVTAGSTHVDIGSRVVGSFIMPCASCDPCVKGQDDMCETFFGENRLKGNLLDGTSRLTRMDGSRLSMYSMGGLAEYAVVPLTALAIVPDDFSLENAAILGCAAFTAFGAVRKSSLRTGESVAVVATGGIGASLIQVAKHAGAHPIIAIDVDDEKLAAAAKLGATFTINSLKEDSLEAVRKHTSGKGVDVSFEALGSPQTFALAVSLLREGGRMVAVGIAAGKAAAEVEITSLVRRGQSIIGSLGAQTRKDLPQVVAMAADGGFNVEDAITKRYALSEANEAYRALDRREIIGRAIIVMDSKCTDS